MPQITAKERERLECMGLVPAHWRTFVGHVWSMREYAMQYLATEPLETNDREWVRAYNQLASAFIQIAVEYAQVMANVIDTDEDT